MKNATQVAASLAAIFLFSQTLHAQSSTRNAPPNARNWRVFPLSSLQKLTAKSDGILLPFKSQNVDLLAARGEWQSFQIVVSAKEKALRFTVAPTAFATVLGQFIARENVQLFRENFVRVIKPSGNRVLEPRFWPDALIPIDDQTENVVAPHHSLAFWIAVKVPRDAQIGQYFAALDVVAKGETRREVALALKVSPTVLPLQTMRANVAVYYDMLRDWYAKNLSPLNDEQFAQMKRNYYDFLLDYGLNAYDLPVGWNSEIAATYLRDSRVHSVRIPPQNSPEFADALAQLKRTNTLQKAYDYRIDEPSPDDYQKVRDATQQLHRADARLKQLVTVAPNANLNGAVDIWCPNIGDFFGVGHLDLDELQRQQKRGRETWFYTMVEPKNPYPTWLLDDDASAIRVYGWIMARENISGFVYSMAHGWGANPLENLESFEGTNGDGTLLYPRDLTNDATQKLRPMPSIRLMLLREAIQDYELLKSLPESQRRALIEYSISNSLLFPDANRAHFVDTFETQRARLLSLCNGENVSIPTKIWPQKLAFLKVGKSKNGAVPSVKSAPQIDGNLSDSVWSARTRWNGTFSRLENDADKWPPTNLWISHDDKFLYVAVRATQSSEKSAKRGAIAVEISPTNAISTSPERWRFVASASGKITTEHHTREGRFRIESGSWKIVRHNFKKANIEYSNVEFQIPLGLMRDQKKFHFNVWSRIWRKEFDAFYTTKAFPDANDALQMPLVTLAP